MRISGIDRFVDDTLWIGIATVFSRCVRDSTRGATDWFLIGDDDQLTYLETERYCRLHKRSGCDEIPKEITIRIQDQINRVPVVLSRMRIFHCGTWVQA